MILPYGHPFWTTYGYPPYHYQCRTGIQGISQTELTKRRIQPENPTVSAIKKRGFAPQAGFGGNPLDAESWWRMPKEMAFRAAEYGIFEDVEAFARKNGLHNFALGLVNGSDWRKLEQSAFKAEKARKADPLQKEVKAAKILTESNHSIYFTPENKTPNLKNPDAIIDGEVADLKILMSKKIDKVEDRIRECDRQQVRIACICAPDNPNYTRQEMIATARRLLDSGSSKHGADTPLRYVKAVYLIYGSITSVLKK